LRIANINVGDKFGMKHQTISFIKSAVRILGYVLLISPHSIWWAVGALVLSEVAGIVEEIGHE
jgi:hypothetical protein